jgi:AAA domain
MTDDGNWLDQRKPRKARWIREGMIPRRTLTLIAGAKGQGKSTFALGLTLDVLINELRRSKVHIYMGEDDQDEQTLPRLLAMGATKKELARIDHAERRWQFPRDTREFAQRMHKLRIKLAVLDPVDRCIPGISHTSAYETLDDLADVASTLDMAILLIGHTNKGGPFKSIDSALGGSRRLIGACKSVFVWGPEPEEGTARPEEMNADPQGKCYVLSQEYSNYGPAGNGVDEPSQLWERVFVEHPLAGMAPIPVYDYVGPVNYQPKQVVNSAFKKPLADGAKDTKKESCKKLILLLLSDADPELGLTATELTSRVVSTMGFSQGTFDDARGELVYENLIEKAKEGNNGPWRYRVKALDVPDAPPPEGKN